MQPHQAEAVAADPKASLVILEQGAQISVGEHSGHEAAEFPVAPTHQAFAAGREPEIPVAIAQHGAYRRAELSALGHHLEALTAAPIERAGQRPDPERTVGVLVQRGDRLRGLRIAQRYGLEASTIEALQATQGADPKCTVGARFQGADARIDESIGHIERPDGTAGDLEHACLGTDPETAVAGFGNGADVGVSDIAALRPLTENSRGRTGRGPSAFRSRACRLYRRAGQ